MEVGCERRLANMAAINYFGGLKYSGNLMLAGHIGNALGPGQAIVGTCRCNGETYARLGAQVIGKRPRSG